MANLDSRGMRATVKWFNPTKGFGFVTLDDGSDAFCHVSALSTLSTPDLPQGATVMCDVAQGQRGTQVTAVHSVDLSTAEAMPSRGPGSPRPSRPRNDGGGTGPMGGGHVKFFNEQKGFGFVVPEQGGADIYIHASALRRSGIPALTPEQRVRFSTRQGMKGVEVDRIEVE
jgi:CspA family cold shock protein